jgi:hypothetical protein
MIISCFNIVNTKLTYKWIIQAIQIGANMSSFLFFVSKACYGSHWNQKIILLHFDELFFVMLNVKFTYVINQIKGINVLDKI